MNVEEMKIKLKSIESVTFSKHYYEPKVKIRGVLEDEILFNLKNPEKLVYVEYQGEDIRGHKYALLFSKSNRYDLKILVSMKDKSINVITTYIQNIKRRKVLDQWLKKRR